MTLRCEDYAPPRAVIPGANHSDAIAGDTQTRELLFTANKRVTSDPMPQPAAYLRGPAAYHQFSSRHCYSPCHVGWAQRLQRYILLGLTAYHLGYPYDRN